MRLYSPGIASRPLIPDRPARFWQGRETSGERLPVHSWGRDVILVTRARVMFQSL